MTHISELESKDCNVVSKQSSCCSERPSLLSYEIPESCTFVGNGKPSLDVFATFYKCCCDSIWNRMKKGGKWKKKVFLRQSSHALVAYTWSRWVSGSYRELHLSLFQLSKIMFQAKTNKQLNIFSRYRRKKKKQLLYELEPIITRR